MTRLALVPLAAVPQLGVWGVQIQNVEPGPSTPKPTGLLPLQDRMKAKENPQNHSRPVVLSVNKEGKKFLLLTDF